MGPGGGPGGQEAPPDSRGCVAAVPSGLHRPGGHGWGPGPVFLRRPLQLDCGQKMILAEVSPLLHFTAAFPQSHPSARMTTVIGEAWAGVRFAMRIPCPSRVWPNGCRALFPSQTAGRFSCNIPSPFPPLGSHRESFAHRSPCRDHCAAPRAGVGGGGRVGEESLGAAVGPAANHRHCRCRPTGSRGLA